MALNEKELKIAQGMKADGYSTDDVINELKRYRGSLETSKPSSTTLGEGEQGPTRPQEDIVSGPQQRDAYNNDKEEHNKNLSTITKGKESQLSSGMKSFLGGIYNFFGGSATGLIETGGMIGSIGKLEDKIGGVPNVILNRLYNMSFGEDEKEILKKVLPEAITKDRALTLEGVGAPMEMSTIIKESAQEKLGVDSDKLTTKIGEFFTPEVLFGVGKGYKAYKTSRTLNNVAKKLDSKIIDDFTKAIKPSTSGKKSAKDIVNYNKKTRDAITQITARVDDLKLTDDFGEAIPGTLPQNTKQFSEAVTSLKSDIYKKYHKIATDLGDDVSVNFKNVVDELDKLKLDDVFMKTASKSEIKHIDDIIEQLSKGGGKSNILDTEAIKQVYNARLQGFYQNPDYSSFGKSSIDAMVNNKIGKLLDDTIQLGGSRQYSALKSIYGNLSTIEKDVAHRAIMESRKSGGGLLDYTSIISARDVAGALAGTDKSIALTKAAASESMKLWYKYITSPDIKIKRIFKNSKKYFELGQNALEKYASTRSIR